MYKLDPAALEWTELNSSSLIEDIPPPREGLGLAAIGDTVYLFGSFSFGKHVYFEHDFVSIFECLLVQHSYKHISLSQGSIGDAQWALDLQSSCMLLAIKETSQSRDRELC